MAPIPKIRRILREDLKEAPAWIEKLIYPLNIFMDSVWYALNKNLTFGENVKGQVYSIKLVAGATPDKNNFTFTLNITNPMGVILLSAVEQGANYVTLTNPVTISSWSYTTTQVMVNSICGLTSGQTYNISVLVI